MTETGASVRKVYFGLSRASQPSHHLSQIGPAASRDQGMVCLTANDRETELARCHAQQVYADYAGQGGMFTLQGLDKTEVKIA